jgi:hypothetical protein
VDFFGQNFPTFDPFDMPNTFFTTELFKAVKALKPSERARLRKAAHSPLLQEEAAVARLFEWIFDFLESGENAQRADLKGADWSAQIAKAVFPALEVQVGIRQLPVVRSQCLGVIRDFLAFEEFRSTPNQKEVALRRALRKHPTLGKLLGERDAKAIYSEDPESERVEILREQYRSALLGIGEEAAEGFDIAVFPDAFFQHVLAERLLQIFVQQAWVDEPGQTKTKIALQDETLDYVARKINDFPLRVQLLFHLCKAKSRPESATSALVLWEQAQHSLSAFEEYQIGLHLRRHFAQRANDPSTQEGLLELERVFGRFQHRTFETMGGMPRRVFLNGILVFTNLGKFEEADAFSARFADTVQDFREACINLRHLFICAKRGSESDLHEIDRLFESESVKVGDAAFEALVRVQVSKAIYATAKGERDFERCKQSMDALRNFVKRNSNKSDDLGAQGQLNLKLNNFIKAMTNLSDFRLKNDGKYPPVPPSQVSQLVQKFKEPMPLGEMEWLKAEARKLSPKA